MQNAEAKTRSGEARASLSPITWFVGETECKILIGDNHTSKRTLQPSSQILRGLNFIFPRDMLVVCNAARLASLLATQ
jgi:hypothetical protein